MARCASVLALVLVLCVRALAAQGTTSVDTVHVLPPDSAGYISRNQLALFRQSLPTARWRFDQVAPWELLPGFSGVPARVAAFDSAVVRSRAAIAQNARDQHLMKQFGIRAATVDTVAPSRRGLFGLSPNTADVSFEGQLQFQLSTTRTRNLACTAAQVEDIASGCSGGFKGPTIDNTVLLTSRGIFAQRIHLDIDFDSKRDYAAGQIVSVSYQGLEDEKIKRVDVGTVQWTPPPSRFFTASIPSNNFGVSAEAVFGPIDVRAILAAQKGSDVKTSNYTIGSTVVSPQDISKRDLDYESGRFFWIVNPKALPAFPAVDILNAGTIVVPADSQPVNVRIYQYTVANQSSGANANYAGITAAATNGLEGVGSLRWRLLKPNVDYWIDPSGLWFALRNNINPSDYLAVSYTTKSGGQVGTLPIVDDSTKHDQLRLIYLPNRGPNSPVFYYEMRQVYRVAGSSMVRSSLRTQILVSGTERPDSGAGTYLSLLGLALPADQATYDIEDRTFPRARDPGASVVIQDALLVFPNAQPFSDPRLTQRARNDSMYVTPEYLLLSQGPPSVFQLHLLFDAQGGSDRNSITLDGLQITAGSEKITANGRQLVKDKDYSIDYTTGRVTFLDPNDLFGNGVTNVSATYELRGLFAVAPTTIAGLSATWTIGIGKSLSLSALYQAEATALTRPPIGSEARASLLAGLSGDFLFNTPWLTNLANRFMTKRSTAPSSIRVAGEIAMSKPDPNRSGDAYLEQFEDDHSVLIDASQNRWLPGSMPKSAAGLLNVLPRGFDSLDNARLILQNLVPNAHDTIVQYSPHDIDATVALTQSSTPTIETVLWAMLAPDTAGGIVDFNRRSHWTLPALGVHSRWGSATQALSPTGLDLTHNDYFEFAVYQQKDSIIKQSGMQMVIDLGKVSEDALSVAPDSFHILQADSSNGLKKGDTVYTGRQYVGVNRLDTEKTFFGTWNALTDDTGILGDRPDSLFGPSGVVRRPALCADSLSQRVALFPWGDLGARCSKNNGNPDSEDLDGDNILDAQGPNDEIFRYVVNFDTLKPIRSTRVFQTPGDTLSAFATWTIYRVALHSPNDTIGNPDMHLIKQMRLTFVAPPVDSRQQQAVFFALARMRFSGASWAARADRPIASLSGATAAPHGSVLIGSVSTQDGDSLGHGYTSPPGIVNAAATTAVSSSSFSEQINEKALSVQATDLHAGERAEGFLRIVSGAQNLLAYTQLRVWVRGGARIGQATSTEGWDDGRLRAYVKVGSDAYNFYLYNAPARTPTWDPEMVIDMSVWQDLRQQIENARLRSPVPSGFKTCGSIGDSTAWIACTPDGAYFVQVRDPQINPPNLSAVQELAAGIYYPVNAGTPIALTELWIDDIRVNLPISRVGYVGALSAHAQIADVAAVDVSGVYQNGNFQQLGQTPTYQNVGSVAAVTTVRVDRFLPTRWGLVIPASVSSNWGWIDPELIAGTDVQAAGIDGLRKPRSDATIWQFSIRHPNRQNEPNLSRLLLSPFAFAASGSAATNVTSLSDATSSGWTTTLTYTLNNRRRAYAIHLKKIADALPKWLQESAAGRGIANATFAPLPTLIQFSSSLSHTMGDLQAYQVPITTLADTILKPVTSEQFLLRNAAGLNWDPFGMLTFTSGWSSTRDLREYPDSSAIARVTNASHRTLLGADLGVERDRNLSNSLVFAPHLASWLGTSATIASNFVLSRTLTSRNPVRIDGDTAGAYILPQTFNDSRVITYRLTVNPRTLAQRIFGDTSKVSKALVQFQPIQVIQAHTLESSFDLARFSPDLSYQLALGGLSSFLTRNGEEAIYAAEATSTTVQATVDLPGGLSAQVNYSVTGSDRYQQQQGPGFAKSTGTTESWPSGRVAWAQTFRGGPFAQIVASTLIQHDAATSSSPFTDGTDAVATSDTRHLAPDIFLRLRNGVGIKVNGQFDNSDASYGGNLTETVSSNVTANVSWSIRMPRFLSASRRSLSTSVTVTQTTSSSCIQHTGDSTCVSYYDLSRLSFNTGFTAYLAQGIQAGLTGGYILNEVRSLGQKTSTITLSAIFSVPLSSLGM